MRVTAGQPLLREPRSSLFRESMSRGVRSLPHRSRMGWRTVREHDPHKQRRPISATAQINQLRVCFFGST
jgi:hypothetical protein